MRHDHGAVWPVPSLPQLWRHERLLIDFQDGKRSGGSEGILASGEQSLEVAFPF
jgi:hypothetical protein